MLPVEDMSADSLDADIVNQGNKIRALKAAKASKEDLKPEIDALLALKTQYKNVTGLEWKPGQQKPQESKPEPGVETSYSGGGLSDQEKEALSLAAGQALDIKIQNCGDFIRRLKADKAAKDAVLKEVEVLKWLKGLYLKKVGKEWAPPQSAAGEKKEKVKPSEDKPVEKPDG